MGDVIDAPALPPPAIVAPAPREVSFGLVAGLAPVGTRRMTRAGRQPAWSPTGRCEARASRFASISRRAIVSVRVTAVDGMGRRSSSVVASVRGLPRRASPRAVTPRLDPVLSRSVVALARGFAGTSGVYVQDLATGQGAAWNAAARFPAASTLKLAVAVTVLRAHFGVPAAGSRVGALLTSMLVRSDNDAANALEVWLAGSTSAGSARVNETMRALGLVDSEMYGGYERTPQRAVDSSRRFRSAPRAARRSASASTRPPGIFARLARAVYLAADGKGPAAGARRHRVGGAAPPLAARARRRQGEARQVRRAGRERPPQGGLARDRSTRPRDRDLGGRRLRRGRPHLELARRRHFRGRPRRAHRRGVAEALSASTDSGRRPRGHGASLFRRRSARCGPSRAGR